MRSVYPTRSDRCAPGPADRRPVSLATALLVVAKVVAVLCLAGTQPASAQEGELSVTVDAATDARIESAIETRLAQIPGAESIEVDVSAGVVSLSGTAGARSAAERAVDLARRTAGVAEVIDGVDVSTDVRRRLQPALDKVRTLGTRVVESIPLILAALLILLLFWGLSRLAVRWSAPYERVFRTRFLRDIARQVIGAVILLVGALLALDVLDATALVSAVLGTAGVLGLAVGFAFRDLVENYIASILLSLRQPFAPNDHVVIGSHEGKVLRLTSRATILMTLDGNHLRIPNADVFKGVVLNYSRNPLRRFNFSVGVGAGEDLLEAQRIGLGVLAGMSAVIAEPKPLALVQELGDSSVVLCFFAWVDQRESDFAKARSEAIRLVKVAFDDAGVDMPEPIYRLQVQRRPVGGGETKPQPSPAVRRTTPDGGSRTEQQDLSADDTIDRQMEDERRREGDADLLDEGRRLE